MYKSLCACICIDYVCLVPSEVKREQSDHLQIQFIQMQITACRLGTESRPLIAESCPVLLKMFSLLFTKRISITNQINNP